MSCYFPIYAYTKTEISFFHSVGTGPGRYFATFMINVKFRTKSNNTETKSNNTDVRMIVK